MISVSNVPNQYLNYEHDPKALKEDDSVARSWMLFMDSPQKNALLPLHIPMAVTVSQAIRLAKQELTKWNIHQFIVTGISKRGWAAWLTSITDPNVVAVVPFLMNLLNTQIALQHMYFSYGENWPIAFYPYYQRGLDKKLKNFHFTQLMKIEDPLQYMTDYSYRLKKISKYIINASGDDFYVPDNTQFYYERLPGEKSIRVLPNNGHYAKTETITKAIIPFVNRFQNSETLPKLKEIFHKTTLSVYFSEPPVKIIRWTAKNSTARDFRYACNIRYTPSLIESILFKEVNKVSIDLNDNIVGWEATFLEVTFNDGYVATSQVYITPDQQDKKYPKTAPPSGGPACQTLPGRGLTTHHTVVFE